MRPKEFEPDEIADAAMQVFWQRGYAATSIQDLVQGTGLSRSSLYSTFESKQGLYERALQRYSAITTANVELLSGAGPAKDLIERLLKQVAESELSDPLQRGCLVANASLELAAHDETVAGLVALNLQRLQQALEALIERGINNGELASTLAPRALARFFVNTIQGMRVLGKGSPVAQRRQSFKDVIAVALSTL
ncbi:MAG: TetR/AcrR family transcriptional regulator [Comamonas sp.]|jgi:TetR/AcrR family transcriptional repressor of nem operon|uniref:TetR/AcrR family transcriptional regulator n=1 Tax=Comamonas sp. TaxID=34028 RepID=UPI002821778B|nr:TetR/AcrR family transcriptional regulator [Comamonas sp.]MDR0213967.1 TetR/AcrR family transcriptional regulator [Comamonas sp.]